MPFAIMRTEKRKVTDVRGMQIHNERQTSGHANLDIDQSKSNLNYSLVECPDYIKKIDEELKLRYTGTKKIRKDAIICTEVLFTSDKEFFEKIGEDREKEFFKKSLEFIENRFGKENIIAAKVHKDETVPHMHLSFVPLHNDGSLSMKKHLDGKFEYQKLQNEYFKEISKDFPELERGKSVTETKRKHLELNDYKKKNNNLDIEIDLLKKENETKTDQIKKIDKIYHQTNKTLKLIEEETQNSFLGYHKIKTIDLNTLLEMAKKAPQYDILKDDIPNIKLKKEYNLTIKMKEREIESYQNTISNFKFQKNKTEKYMERLEKTLQEKAPDLLREIQSEHMQSLPFGASRDAFVREKKDQGRLEKSLIAELNQKQR